MTALLFCQSGCGRTTPDAVCALCKMTWIRRVKFALRGW